MARMQVEVDGSLTVGGVAAHGGSWYRCLMSGGWCDVLVERGPAPDVQQLGPGGWYVSLPWQYRGLGVDGLDVYGVGGGESMEVPENFSYDNRPEPCKGCLKWDDTCDGSMIGVGNGPIEGKLGICVHRVDWLDQYADEHQND